MTAGNQEISNLLNSVPDYIQKVHCDTKPNTSSFKCAVKSCKNDFLGFNYRDKYPFKFHNFPSHWKLRKIWKLHCGLRESDHVKGLMICSDHFELNDYIRNYKEEFQNPQFKRKLKPDAFPTQKCSIVNMDEISDNEYETDLESLHPEDIEGRQIEEINNFLSNFPKECTALKKQPVTNLAPLDYKEVKKEVDHNIKLNKKQLQLQKDLKRLRMQVKIFNRKVKLKKTKISQIKKRRGLESKMVQQVFSDAQFDLLQGKKVYWTDDDLARAFTLRHMGTKKCYLYMKNKLNFPLPALSCVQKWASTV